MVMQQILDNSSPIAYRGIRMNNFTAVKSRKVLTDGWMD